MGQYFRVIAVIMALLSVSFNPAYAEEGLEGRPFMGVISADRVNVRASDNKSSEVICQLSKGEEVSVLGRRGDWLKIDLPARSRVYIAKATVSKKDGSATVIDDKANIRTAATKSSAVVGRLPKDASVKIIREYLDWYEIEAPRGSYGWVFSSYVKKGGEISVNLSSDIPRRLAELDENYRAELKKPLREIELKWILQEYQKLAADAKGSSEEQQALLRAEEVKLKVAEIEHLKAKEDYDSKIKNISSPRPGEAPLVSGVIGNVGRISGRLSQYKITKDGRFIGYLTSSKVDLNSYVNVPVNIWGVKKEVKGVALFEADAVQIAK